MVSCGCTATAVTPNRQFFFAEQNVHGVLSKIDRDLVAIL